MYEEDLLLVSTVSTTSEWLQEQALEERSGVCDIDIDYSYSRGAGGKVVSTAASHAQME